MKKIDWTSWLLLIAFALASVFSLIRAITGARARGTLFALSFLIVLVSCSTQRKLNKAEQMVRANPSVAAKICADLFPAKDSTIKGDTIILIDTVTRYLDDGDTGYRTGADYLILEQPQKIAAPKQVTRTITVTKIIHDTLIRVDKSREKLMEDAVFDLTKQLEKKDASISKAKHERNIWRIIALAEALVLGAGFILRIKKLI